MTSVVIVGSGFTGFECARHLAKRSRKHDASVGITTISPVDDRSVTIALAGTLKGARAVRGRVDGVDFENCSVILVCTHHRAVQERQSVSSPTRRSLVDTGARR